MIHTDGMKEVSFYYYCETCVNKDVEETEDPCNECLTEGARQNSHKPVKWEEK